MSRVLVPLLAVLWAVPAAAQPPRQLKPLENVKTPFPRISYDEAVKLLNDKGHKFEWGGDLGSPDETEISKSFASPDESPCVRENPPPVASPVELGVSD